MAERRLLILGASGQVGYELCRALAPLGKVVAVTRNSAPSAVNLARPETVTALIEDLRPSLVVNAAAYTAVDRAEAELEQAAMINTHAVAALAECVARLKLPLIHYSTDYVFDGKAQRPYVETDATAPLNVYGHSKRGGELALLDSDAACLVLRTSWVYAARGQNFLRTVMRLAQTHSTLRIVDDQHGAPTWARALAEVTALIVYRLGFASAPWQKHRGLYHVTNAGQTTWCGFARAILRIATAWPGIVAQVGSPGTELEFAL